MLKYSVIRQPCKDDKLKYAKIMPFQAGSDYSLSAKARNTAKMPDKENNRIKKIKSIFEVGIHFFE